MWALGVLLAALLTGGVPPLAQHLGRAPREGLSVDALQAGVTSVVRRALDGRGVCFAARVRSPLMHACTPNGDDLTTPHIARRKTSCFAASVCLTCSGLREEMWP